METEERPVEELAPAQEQPAAQEPAQEGPAARELPQPEQQAVPPVLDYALEEQLARGRRVLNEEMRIIGALDPGVKSLADLKAQPEFGRFDRLVKSGLAISDAYKLACFERLGRQQATAARQAAINAMRGKEHLAPVGGGPDAEDGLTDEIIQNYRQYNPRWTRAQIAAFHRSYKQGV
ncbi:MAG TPA: hypothetical protein H9813_01780 [Candidatus Fournierella merdipullorum]|uniref:Uncharacterized protein n=1 Tax=Candidatus Allofournierella merdipullorum TaxID=2838595 RepID=A0A9D2E364_9FIRM|nr:hypothetical protein [Candidatus Fournierella merdipullorum]